MRVFAAQAVDFYSTPSFLTSQVPPIVMLVMGKNHKLYYEAYNDASDLNEDGTLDVGYKGESEPFVDANGNDQWDFGETFTDVNGDGKWTAGIDYYGYFDSYKCYNYSSADNRFEPAAAPVSGTKPSKKCEGVNTIYWSGDFLNYLTMSRMDALRKVLYGGYRSTDDPAQTILERVFIPQDAHTWGKEYESEARDGYDIRNYTPLGLPATGTRHLFASTTLSDNGDPVLRVLPNNTHRIWEWVAKEGPVADSSLENATGGHPGHPNSHNDYDDMVSQHAISANLMGSRTVSSDPTYNGQINGSGNPFGSNDNYLTIFGGQINIPIAGNYRFAVDGDDAVEVIIDGNFIVGWHGGHGRCNCQSHDSSPVYLTAGLHTIEFRHEEATGGDNYYLWWEQDWSGGFGWQIVPALAFDSDGDNVSDLTQSTFDLSNAGVSTITDYEVRVEVCNPSFPESNCKQYPSGALKPVGLLQKYGEDEKMYFGLLTGSYDKNTAGGVLRKNISSFTDEIDTNTGVILTPASGGIVDTINKFRITQFNYGSYNYSPGWPGAWVTTRPMNDGEFPDWGNPTAEMMYETIRYFAGKASPTSIFDYSGSTIDSNLGLPKPAWQKPYDIFSYCASPYMLVLSDIYPTFDSDQLPGSHSNFGPSLPSSDFTTGANNTDIMDVEALADAIATGESINGNHFIGQEGSNYDGACTAKSVSSLGDIRGLCPEEPTKEGSYYAAAVAYYGAKYDINAAADGAQRVSTFSVGLASPLPKINIEVDVGTAGTPDIRHITLIPFAKSVGGCLGINGTQGLFQPTDTIVDFFVETITPTYGKFRVNFEDVEQAADHDMDAIVVYEYTVNNGQVDITLSSTYASGCIQQHVGYIISGTTNDGIYLEVRDEDTSASSDVDYFLDTPPGQNPGGTWNDGVALPRTTTRRFDPGTTSGATLIENPLYYAAKWGGFQDRDTKDEDANNNGRLDPGEDLNGNGKVDYLSEPTPNIKAEWDRDGDDIPDSYFYVVNPLRLEEQLSRSFAEMLRRASSGTAASVISSSRSGEGAVYQSVFYPEYEDEGGKAVQWVGQVQSFLVDGYGNMRVDMYKNSSGVIVSDTASGFGLKQLNTRNEDLNYNGLRDTGLDEDTNSNNILDPGEDLNLNGRLDHDVDEPDYDGDGLLDYRDLIAVFDNGTVSLWDDRNENGIKDNEDDVRFTPDIPSWHNNGILDTEDTNGNGVLDTGEDINGNGHLDSEDLNSNGTLDTELVATGYSPDEIKYLWNSKDWIDAFTLDPLTQRLYNSVSDHRYIFTFVDEDNDMVVDSGENRVFEATSTPSLADMTDLTKIYSYLTLYPSFSDKPAWVANIEAEGNRNIFLPLQAKRVVDFIRGEDQTALTIGSYTVPAMRSRQYRPGGSTVDHTWRLGDIVSSSPTLVGRPAENYHLIYRDESYAHFLVRYLNRRSVVYAGANDGMIHAFNGGFYDHETRSFKTQIAEPYIDANDNGSYDPGEKYSDLNGDNAYTPANQTPYPLGAEIWAYVPFNLLPHLYWLTEDTYPHVFYNDLSPKIFDARIFQEDTDHPMGWGTVMVIGMKFGGGHIYADTNRDDIVDATDKEMTSAFVVFDITNPEVAPKVLAEITLPEQGYTTCYPTVVPMRSKSGSGSTISFNTNDWYLVFGSGPADENGIAASRDTVGSVSNSGTIGSPSVLGDGKSLQTGKLFVVNLKALTDPGNERIEVIDDSGNAVQVTSATTSAFIENFDGDETTAADDEPAFISQPITVDYNLNFNAEAVYFGTIMWDSANSSWGGQLKRLIIADSTTTSDWVDTISVGAGGVVDRADNVLFDLRKAGTNNLSQPITVAPSITIGEKVSFDIDGSDSAMHLSDQFDRERWVFFGTGRFIVGADASDNSLQSYYGIKEPYDGNNGFTWEEVQLSSLMESTNIEVYNGKIVKNHPFFSPNDTTWENMIQKMEDGTYDGWYIDFQHNNERNLGQAALLGGLLTFTTYLPSVDICVAEGTSRLYARWYQTGTSFYKPIFRTGNIFIDANGNQTVDDGELRIAGDIDLGSGLALTPNIHTGREKGTTAYIQTSTGDIITISQGESGSAKSEKTSWLQQR
jgi:type IV pilus assembly protein PilY1